MVCVCCLLSSRSPDCWHDADDMPLLRPELASHARYVVSCLLDIHIQRVLFEGGLLGVSKDRGWVLETKMRLSGDFLGDTDVWLAQALLF